VSTGDRSYAAALAGRVSGEGRRFAVVVSRFNSHITEPLQDSAVRCLIEHGTDADHIEVHWVPGAWELPQACGWIAHKRRHDAVLALGCLIRGETAHFDLIGAEVTRGLGAITRDTGIPIVFGVLTTESDEQARERADPSRGDKGRESALAALEMADLYVRIGRTRAGL
jgi:6,7-dimethyl-8-ribityllumazine synthase